MKLTIEDVIMGTLFWLCTLDQEVKDSKAKRTINELGHLYTRLLFILAEQGSEQAKKYIAEVHDPSRLVHEAAGKTVEVALGEDGGIHNN